MVGHASTPGRPLIITNPPQDADDLRVASFVASNKILPIAALCTVFIVTCTDGLGAHAVSDEFGTRNASLAGCARAVDSNDSGSHKSRFRLPLTSGASFGGAR